MIHQTATALVLAALAALGDAHGVIIQAQGEAGSPPSIGFKVNPEIARNCTSINPCQQDSTLIRDAEIAANIVNTCGRTELSGNIDVGDETENALASGAVTSVTGGTTITMTIHQVNADGAGPYVCDLDQTSNAGVFTNLSVTDNVPGVNGLSQVRAQDFQVKVTMPTDLNCIGGSTGNICTVRCRNNAQAGPFGGCFAVQQTGKKANVNAPANIKALKDLPTVLSQVAQNNKDFPVAAQAIANQGSADALKEQAAVNAILKQTFVSKASPQQTVAVDGINGGAAAGGAAGGAAGTPADAAASPTPTAATGNGRNNRNGKNRGNNAANGAAANGNAANRNNNGANNAAASKRSLHWSA